MSLRDRLVGLRDRFSLVEWGVALFALAIVMKAAKVQLLDGQKWADRATRQQTREERLPAPRGRILDASGEALVESRQLVTFNIAPREVRPADRALLASTLKAIRVPPKFQRRSLDTLGRWVNVPGRYQVADAAPLLGMRGVYATYEMARLMAVPSRGVRAVVGGLDAGRAVSGLELSLDSLLQGVTGSRQLIKTGRGDRLETPDAPMIAPIAGNELTLTINYGIQDVAEQALEQAVATNGADGGDVVVIDPRSGEIIALASRTKSGVASKLTAVVDPYEPGSTLKPFVVAQLLADGSARPDEMVNTYNGVLNYRGFRKITDAHVARSMSVTEVLAQSSNIGIVTLRDRMSDRTQYELMRNLGFGTPTGVYPGESGGRLRPLGRWDRFTPSSMAMGYEILVTPLQLALAYAAIANGGLLMEPTLVREIRSPDGSVRWHHRPREVRRVFSPAVAQTMREVLKRTITDGTGKSAALTRFTLAGKSGTTKVLRDGSYNSGDYIASFVGIFPADDPQLVILAKLDKPRAGAIYGGLVAAPIIKAIIEGAVASTRTSIDRIKLASQVLPNPPGTDSGVVAESVDTSPLPASRTPRRARRDSSEGAVPFVIALAPVERSTPVSQSTARAVPSVDGMALREALFTLHEQGFRVIVDSLAASGTSPASGTRVVPGTVVRVHRAP